MPQFSFGDGYTGNTGGNYSNQPSNVYQIFNSYTKVAGSHIVKFAARSGCRTLPASVGRTPRGYTLRYRNVGQTDQHVFRAHAGRRDGAVPAGVATSGVLPINATSKADAYYGALFVQDDWHVRSN